MTQYWERNAINNSLRDFSGIKYNNENTIIQQHTAHWPAVNRTESHTVQSERLQTNSRNMGAHVCDAARSHHNLQHGEIQWLLGLMQSKVSIKTDID